MRFKNTEEIKMPKHVYFKEHDLATLLYSTSQQLEIQGYFSIIFIYKTYFKVMI